MTVKFMVCKAKLRLVVSSAVEGGAILFEDLYPGVCSSVMVRLRPPAVTGIHPRTSFAVWPGSIFSREMERKLEVIW